MKLEGIKLQVLSAIAYGTVGADAKGLRTDNSLYWDAYRELLSEGYFKEVKVNLLTEKGEKELGVTSENST